MPLAASPIHRNDAGSPRALRASQRTGVWHGIALAGLLALPIGGALPAHAAGDAAVPLSAQATIEALARAHAAVVGVQAVATDGARSIGNLGKSRGGSGVVIGDDGLVLTIGYLLTEAEQVQLLTQDGRRMPARALAYDVATGFGLVQPLLPLRGVPAVPLGSIRDLENGVSLMVATGGADGNVDTTQLVGKRAFSGNWEYHIDSALFTSPPVANHSGAPLFNQRGELVGIGSLLMTDVSAGGQRVPGNMFVPVDLLRPILAELRQTGSSRGSHRPWLGLNSAERGGRVQIVRVNDESPAQAAGLQAGDVLLAIDGDKVESLEGFYKKLWGRASPEAEVNLTIQQGAEVKTLTLRGVDRMSTLKKPAGI